MRRRDFIALAATSIAAPAIVEDAVASAAAQDERGEVQEPRPPPEEPLHIIVNLRRQRLFVFRGDEVIASTRVSTGRRAYPTPRGTFPILEKQAEHYSNLYNYAPMHYMQRLTWDGVTLHAGRATGRPRSHGCVVMPTRFARALFAVTRIGTRVVVE
jgi:lipoprotein-anchoring transpeptidase ErfK/SrfK